MMNPTELEALCKLFPELSPAQAANVILLSMGASQEEIAEIRHVSAASVKRSLHDARTKLNMTNLGSLRPAILLRVMSSMFTCISANKCQQKVD